MSERSFSAGTEGFTGQIHGPRGGRYRWSVEILHGPYHYAWKGFRTRYFAQRWMRAFLATPSHNGDTG